MKKLRGMVLAAGEGTRLRPLTYFRAKPAVPFLGKPLINYSLDLLETLAVKDIAVNLHYLPETVETALQDRNENITLSREETILGTGGCLGKLRDYFSGCTIVLSNGKIFFREPELERALKQHFDSRSMVTMVLVPFSEDMPFKKVFLDPENNILGFSRNVSSGAELKKIQEKCGTGAYVYTGIQILAPEVLSYIPDGYSDTVADIYPRLISAGYPLKGYVSNGFWRECSTPERYLEASVDVIRDMGEERHSRPGIQGNVSFEDGTFTGDSVKIPHGTRLQECVIWNDSLIGPGSCFENVIITGTSGILPDQMKISNAVITPWPVGSVISPPDCVRIGPGYAVWPL